MYYYSFNFDLTYNKNYGNIINKKEDKNYINVFYSPFINLSYSYFHSNKDWVLNGIIGYVRTYE